MATNPTIAQMMAELKAAAGNEPLDIVGNTKRNLQGALNVAKSVPGNLQRMVTDPVAYAKSLPQPSGEQIMNMFQPGHIGAMAGVIKPKGGNWVRREPSGHGNVEEGFKRLLPYQSQEGILPYHEAELARGPVIGERQMKYHQDMIAESKRRDAMNKWVESNLQNYFKKEMGTPDDPIRALHEQGITHLPRDLRESVTGPEDYTREARVAAGFPEKGMGKSELAQQWETLSDENIYPTTAGRVQEASASLAKLREARNAYRELEMSIGNKFDKMLESQGQLSPRERDILSLKTPIREQAAMVGDNTLDQLRSDISKIQNSFERSDAAIAEANPWASKLAPETDLYYGLPSGLGFDHVIDVLKQDIESGRIRPDQLNKVSVSDAVRRTHEFDQEMARKMAEAQIKATEGMPVHKEYPEGYKWIELALPKELPKGWKEDRVTSDAKKAFYLDPEGKTHITHPNEKMLADALKYEGDTMGHCVGGYCPDVLEGRSRIYSLRDPKGEPHVTIETSPTSISPGEWYASLNPAERQAVEGYQGYNIRHSPQFKAAQAAAPESIVQIKGKQNAAPKEQYLPYVQDFVKSGKWSDVGDIQNTGLRSTSSVFNDAELQKLRESGETNIPHILSGEDIQRLHNIITPEGKRLKYDIKGNIVGGEEGSGYARGGKVHLIKGDDQKAIDAMKLATCGCNVQHKAEGGNVQPSLAQMRMAINQVKGPVDIKDIGVNEAPNMSPKIYMPPVQNESSYPAPGGVATRSGMPIGGIDQSQQPGQQLMPLPQGMPGAPGQPPMGAAQQGAPAAPQGGLPAPQGPTPPMGNMLSMTPQGQTMQALGGGQPKPPGMAKGGTAKSVDEMKAEMASKSKDADGKRVTIHAEGPGGVKGLVVPRHTLEGNAKSGAVGIHEMNEARARVYGSEHREPLNIGKIGETHKKTLAEHFAKPVDEQVEAEKAALGRLREAKHLGKDADTLDESEKLDTVRHEHDEEGRTHVGYASKGVAGHALYTSGHGKDTKYHVINTCPGQTEGCGGGKDAEGIVDTKKGTCFAPNAESQYPGAATRRAAHEQAKHDPAMTNDWILAHTHSLRNAANRADKKNQRTLFRPNVVDETDVSSRHVIRHLNEQRKAEGKPGIIANSYGKTNELHDPENGYHVTHSNVGPKVKKGESIAENISRDKARVRNTIMAADNKGDFKNEQGHKTPPKGSYMVTDVKRGSPMAKKMEEHITHAKYWTTGREEHELTPEEKAEGPEGHYSGSGRKTTEDKAHYGHKTVESKRFDYQKQHILHPRLVQVGHNKDGTPHMIPTDSRFKDVDFLPKNRFKTKNGKEAGHILMTTPTESTSNVGHETSFTHNVSPKHIEHAMANNGEYEIDKPEDQLKAAGKEYRAPQAIKLPSTMKLAEGGMVFGRHPGYSDEDFHAFPEQNIMAQRHLAMRHGDDEGRVSYHSGHKKAVNIHKNIDTMRLELTRKK